MIRVTTWGTRGSIPVSGQEHSRYGGNTTCLEIELLGATAPTPERLLIDCGSGLSQLGREWGDRPPRALVLQTHMHWDHIQGFPFFGPLYHPQADFQFWATKRDGWEFPQALRHQMIAPCFPITLDIFGDAPSFHTIAPIGSRTLGEATLTWTDLHHPSGSTAWRVDYRGTSFVFSGDVEVQLGTRDRLLELTKGADLLLMDSQYLAVDYPPRVGFGHSTPEDGLSIAEEAGIGYLLLTHHDPTHDDDKLDKKASDLQQKVNTGLHLGNARDRKSFTITRQSVETDDLFLSLHSS